MMSPPNLSNRQVTFNVRLGAKGVFRSDRHHVLKPQIFMYILSVYTLEVTS